MKSKEANLLSTCLVVVCTITSILFWNNNLQLGFDSANFHLWQLVTAHIAHYDAQHLVSNMLAFGLLVFIVPSSLGEIIKGFIVAIVLIDAYLLLWGVKFYVGFSGLLYVILGLAMGRMLQRKQFVKLASLCLGIYLYMFHFSDQLHMSSGVVWYSMKQSHFLGLLAGFLVTLVNNATYKGTKPPNRTIMN